MGNSFTTSSSSQQSTPPAPRETWAQRMSRREHRRRDPRDPRDGANIRFRDSRQAPVTTKTTHTGEQEEVDQLTAFRTGAFDGLDSRNGSAP